MSSTNETSDTPSETDEQSGSESSETGPANEALVETRRNAAKFFAALGGAAAIGSFAVTGLTGLNAAAGVTGEKELTYKTIYVKGTRLVTKSGDPVTLDALERGSGKVMNVYPEKKGGGGALVTKKTTTLLTRFTEDAYQKPTKLDWTVQGYSAYSAVCTHAGCIVSSMQDSEHFGCPCHGSRFDPLQGAKVVGGPAPEPLPQLPIGTTQDGNVIVATGHFEGELGPG